MAGPDVANRNTNPAEGLIGDSTQCYGDLGEIENVGLRNLVITYTKLVTKLLFIVYFSTLTRTKARNNRFTAFKHT